MRSDLCDLTIVLDKSGSMASCRADAEGGLNAFIDDQKKQPGYANLTLVQFDTDYKFVHRGVPIQEVGHCTLQPGGMTALLDAVGRAINDTGDRLRRMHEHDRPGLVIFMIITDGEENSSREFTRTQIRQMIEHQQAAYNWQFSYLGANQDAFAEGQSFGIRRDSIANYDVARSQATYGAMSSNATRMRSATAQGLAANSCYTPVELAAMQGSYANPAGTYADSAGQFSAVDQAVSTASSASSK